MPLTQKKQISISPQYLIQISQIVQLLDTFYSLENLPSITPEYRHTLTQSFTALNQNFHIYNNNTSNQSQIYGSGSMLQASILKCKAQIQTFCLEKLAMLLSKQTEQIGNLLHKMIGMYRENMEDFQKIVLMERRMRIQGIQNQKDVIIEKLREELVYRKQHISEMKERLEEVENQNSKIYQKIIGNAKNISQRTLSISPKKHNISSNLKQGLNSSIAKLKSEALLGTAHKTLSAKQVQQTIIDILQTKQRQQTVKGKKVSLKNFLKTYFRYKFGMKQLAEQTEINFKEAVEFFSQSQEKNIFIMFLKMCAEQCEEGYFWEREIFYEKLVKVIKRYVNQKDGIPLDQLERIYQNKIIDERLDIRLNQKDVQYILINTYKTSEIDSLQMILNQILIQKIQKSPTEGSNNQTQSLPSSSTNNNDQQLLIPSKKLINQILNYQLSRHLLKIQDIVRTIRDIDNSGRGYLNQEDLQNVIVRMNISQEKIEANLENINFYRDKFVTYSETIQIVEKIRRYKIKKIGGQRNANK